MRTQFAGGAGSPSHKGIKPYSQEPASFALGFEQNFYY